MNWNLFLEPFIPYLTAFQSLQQKIKGCKKGASNLLCLLDKKHFNGVFLLQLTSNI